MVGSQASAVRFRLPWGTRGIGWTQLRQPQQSDPYTILGVSRGAQRGEIKEAYRRAALKTHPDTRHGDAVEFQRVQDAYARLMEPAAQLVDRLQQHDGHRRPSAAPAQAAYKPFRTVNEHQADEIFQRAFGKNVEEVLKEEMARSGVLHGVHSNAIREAMFVQLLSKARLANANSTSRSSNSSSSSTADSRSSANEGGGTSSGSSKSYPPQGEADVGGNARDTQHQNNVPLDGTRRQHFVDEHGRRAVRVWKKVQASDGTWSESVTTKLTYRL